MARIKFDPEKLRMIMARKGLSTFDVRDRSRGKITDETVRRMRKGLNKSANTATMGVLAKALGVEVKDLLAESENPSFG